MNIFYLEWKSFANEDMFGVLHDMGHNVIRINFEDTKVSEAVIQKLLADSLKEQTCDLLFSFNYFPEVSKCCQKMGITYAAWVYDSPYINVYSYTILNECNRVFLFDYAMYEELKAAGISNVFYLPLAVNEKRLESIRNKKDTQEKYRCDISFVGSLYSEPKHRLYDKFQNINFYAKGYLDGLIQAQLKVYGCNFLREMLTPEIVEEMQKIYPTDPNASTVLSAEAIYADYVLARQVTAIERQDILKRLAATKYRIDLYTYDAKKCINGVNNRGIADYYDEMPYIFMNSKINLNITLRSIRTGIPLRALDIMGCGGFLITNYQEEMGWYFKEGEDYVCYTDYEDLMEKIDYYLKHDNERKRIAENGCQKVRENHTLRKRIKEMIEMCQNT